MSEVVWRVFVTDACCTNSSPTVQTFKIFLPLPPSKNARWKTKGYFDKRLGRYVSRQVLADSVTEYRDVVKMLVGEQLRLSPCVFTNSWLHIRMVWKVPNLRSDVINYHQDLADAIQGAIGINDKWYLLHDDEVVVDKENPGVEVVLVH